MEYNEKETMQTTTNSACVEAEIPDVEYLSLKNSNAPYLEDIKILPEIIKFLRQGKRIDAFEYYINNSDYEYSKIIDILMFLEDNLNDIVKDNKSCRCKDGIGKYEFQRLQSLITTTQHENYDGKITIELNCKPIHDVELISSKNVSVIQNKAQSVVKKFANHWSKVFYEYHEERENKIVSQIYSDLDNILLYGLMQKSFDWEELKDNSTFQSNLQVVNEPKEPNYIDVDSIRKNLDDNKNKIFDKNSFKKNWYEKFLSKIYLSKFSDKLFNKRMDLSEKEFKKQQDKIIDEINDAIQLNTIRKNLYNENLNSYNEYIKNLTEEKNQFIKNQEQSNKNIDELKAKFNNKDIETVEKYFEYILGQSIYPIWFNKNIAIKYNDTNNILIIDYILPNLNDIYNIKNIKKVGSKGEYKLNYITEKQHKALYDKVIYQICFRTINEVFNADYNNFIDTVVFNGYSNSIDKKDGQLKLACIMSLQVTKTDFNALNLENIEPKSCFKSLKGVAAVELASFTPIKPILSLDKADSRFIEAYEVMNTIEDGYNLATMDWQDFENLIREIFEQEFSSNGGEVKVTQSSRDGGVDAIAFDPDPIRGGKIVIQAKRYTNVVGVSAVRDLYGTVMNEGAIKGILVTTADYGSDSYDFAKDKPLTLLNGGHLLHLLEKHGHKARINLQEAKDYFKKQEENKN